MTMPTQNTSLPQEDASSLSESSTMRTTAPAWPKRVVVTAGMPYGNKPLHFGHIGGVFVPADAFARFLRDRIGKENVLVRLLTKDIESLLKQANLRAPLKITS